MQQQNIILTGFMGTGKSTLGRRLAQRLGYTFVDTDELIEERCGCTIAEIFADRGESWFRQQEEALVRDLAGRQGLVIATGGGLVMNPVNVAALQASGRIICLSATPPEILARVSRQRQVRPLLQGDDPLTAIRELLERRQPVYRQFPQLVTSGRSIDQLIEDLLALLAAPPASP
ncbi:MAG: shikimate kinase [Pelovirga sp.]